MPTVLLTGIEPFDGETINPSWEAARRLDGAVIGGATVAARQLPCVLSEVLDRLHGALEETRPDLVVCLGQASGRSDVSVERWPSTWWTRAFPTMPAASPSTSR